MELYSTKARKEIAEILSEQQFGLANCSNDPLPILFIVKPKSVELYNNTT